MCEVFATSFGRVFVPGVPADRAPFQSYPGHMPDVEITRESIAVALSALDPTFSPGPDGLHPNLLKAFAVALSVPLHLIFAQSLRTGLVPAMWKESSVVPLFKKSSLC